MRIYCILAIALSLAVAGQGSSSKGKVLVLIDSLDLQGTHSKFLQSIKSKGYETTVASVNAKTTKLKDWDTWLFDKLVILGGENNHKDGVFFVHFFAELGEGIKPSLIREFFNAGHDVFIALSSSACAQLRDLSQNLGVDVDSRGTTVIDHFNFDSNLGGTDHTVVRSAPLPHLTGVFSSSTKGPLAYRGVGLSVSPDSEVAFLAITGSKTAYSDEPGKPNSAGVALAGSNLGLVALVQGRNNARLAVSGSTDVLSDDLFAYSGANNAAITADLLQWTFHQRGVLKAGPLRHRNIGGEEAPALYRIKDDVEVELEIMECIEDSCKPFMADDVQIEFVMLDPHLRTTLSHDGKGMYSARVKVPDVYGVFKWVLEYRRPGYSWITASVTVPVRPFRHDEYERFIVQAYPYYASVVSMMAGFFVLGIFFLNMHSVRA